MFVFTEKSFCCFNQLSNNNYFNVIYAALIELPQSVQFSLYVHPVPLPDNCETPEIVDAATAGHGAISDYSDYSHRLHFAHLTTLPDHVCHGEFPFLDGGNSIICAVNKQLKHSVCHGDSGGPLVTKSNVTLIGVTNIVKQSTKIQKKIYLSTDKLIVN